MGLGMAQSKTSDQRHQPDLGVTGLDRIGDATIQPQCLAKHTEATLVLFRAAVYLRHHAWVS